MQATLHVYCSFKGTAVLQEPTHELVIDLNFKLQMLTLITFTGSQLMHRKCKKEIIILAIVTLFICCVLSFQSNTYRKQVLKKLFNNC